VSAELTIAGDGFRLLLVVHGYERPELDSGADANWLMAEADLTASGPGSYSASEAVSLRTEEIAAFREELAELVERLDGQATLEHMEEQIGCTITLRRGAGEFDGFVRQHVGAELRVSGLRTDQSYLRQSLSDLDNLVRQFPVKGDPLG
jgi:hypothetical protein